MVPQPFFCDKHFAHKHAGKGRILLCRSSDLWIGRLHPPAAFLPSRIAPVTDFHHRKASPLTAAVPFGNHTRLSCSAAEVPRPSCHTKGYQVVEMIIPIYWGCVNSRNSHGSKTTAPDSKGTASLVRCDPFGRFQRSLPAGGRSFRPAPGWSECANIPGWSAP